MARRCCEGPRLTRILTLRSGASGHLWVASCAACAGALIEYYSFDDWDTGAPETWSMYWWWHVDQTDMTALLEIVGMCPAPLDPGCACEVHKGLGGQTPRPLPPSAETTYDDAEVPRTSAAVIDGRPSWTPPDRA